MGHKIISRIALAALGVGLSALPLTAALAAESAMANAWTGPYVGLLAGLASTSNDWNAKSVGPGNVFGVDPTTANASLSGMGGRFGGYAGWDFAITPEVIAGVEGDIAGIAGGKKKISGLPGASYFGATPSDSLSASQDFDASLRVRLGYAADRDFLVYGTTGVAFQNAQYKASCPANSASSWCGVPESGSVSKTLVGWTLGAGAEAKLAPAIAVRAEYRYAGFGSQNANFFSASNSGADSFSGKTDPSSHIITFGVAYRFGGF